MRRLVQRKIPLRRRTSRAASKKLYSFLLDYKYHNKIKNGGLKQWQ